MPKLADLMYAHMDIVFMNTFTDQSMDIGCVVKLRHLSGSLGECLLNTSLDRF